LSLIDLTQQEADSLLKMEKVNISEGKYHYPQLGGSLQIPLTSLDKREEFILDITRGYISLAKNTFQNRARKTVILARLDTGGPAHQNPDGSLINCPHIHMYREGFGDKWAFNLPDIFSNPNDLGITLDDFMAYCNIVKRPNIEKGLELTI